MSKSTHRPVQVSPISPDQLQSRQGELSLVDARSWLEYITGHIPGAELFKRDSEALPWQVECWLKFLKIARSWSPVYPVIAAHPLPNGWWNKVIPKFTTSKAD